jgi:hypothetical protein
MIEQFLGTVRLSTARDCRVTVFREPKLAGAYPDVVFVIWKPSVARNWRPERSELQNADLKVLQYLVLSRRASSTELIGVFDCGIERNLQRLESAGLIACNKNVWRARPLSSIFATVSIIAIEAKLRSSQGVLQQAFLNTWFASSSYVLLPELPSRVEFLEAATSFGIGILSGSPHLRVGRSIMRPRSYASWQLNEWAWQASLKPEQANAHRY